MTWLKVPLSQLSINKALMLNRHNTQNKDSVTEQITESVSNFNLEPFSIWKWVLNYWPAEIFSCAKSLVFSLGFSEHFPSLHLCSYLSTPRWQTKLNDLSPTSLTLLSLLRHISNRISLKTLPLSQTFFFFFERRTSIYQIVKNAFYFICLTCWICPGWTVSILCSLSSPGLG